MAYQNNSFVFGSGGLLESLSKWEYMVLPYLVIQYIVLPYMVLCNVYKQYIVDLESFVPKNVIVYKNKCIGL